MNEPRWVGELRLPHPADIEVGLVRRGEAAMHSKGGLRLAVDVYRRALGIDGGGDHRPGFQRQLAVGHQLVPGAVGGVTEDDVAERIDVQRIAELRIAALIDQRQGVPRIGVQGHPGGDGERSTQSGNGSGRYDDPCRIAVEHRRLAVHAGREIDSAGKPGRFTVIESQVDRLRPGLRVGLGPCAKKQQ